MSSVKAQPLIPDKLYFKIGEVAHIVGVKPYVLRYWETEFNDISPAKSRSKQRLYKRRDVDRILAIRNLLYQERYTIDGARKRLKELDRGEKIEVEKQQIPLFEATTDKKLLKRVRDELHSLMKVLRD